MEKYTIDSKITQLISAEQAFHYRIVPFSKLESVVILKTDTENKIQLASELSILLDFKIKLEHCEPSDLENYLTSNYRQAQSNNKMQLTYSSDFLEKIIMSAQQIGSSDIHFEPYEIYCRVRFRLDGKLIEQYTISLQEYPTIVNKIKIRANLDISEKRLPQDGRITIKSKASDFDIRVSSLP
ncbi:MAG: ATPase, T2SS/T4P/T4SS family, partial [Cellulophaga sp.]